METARELPVVTHLTQIVLQLSLTREEIENAVFWTGAVNPKQVELLGQMMMERANRVASMMRLLASHGFEFEIKKNVVYAYSNTVEAFEAKRSLLDGGFRDREFQIVLEYTRGWGML